MDQIIIVIGILELQKLLWRLTCSTKTDKCRFTPVHQNP